MEADPRVGEWAKWSIAASGGVAAAADSFGTSLLYEVVEKLWTGQPFESGMIERACVSAGRAGVRSTLQTYLAVDDFLTHARRAFNARIVQRVAQGVVWTGAVADVVVSTAIEVWRWMKNEISFDELLRRFGVHVVSGVGGALGVGAALALARGAPGWVQVVLMLGLGFMGWKFGRAIGDEVFKPAWETAPGVEAW